MLLNDRVERRAFLADEISAAGTAHLGVEEERKLVETAQTVAFVELSVFRQQLSTFHIILNLRLDSPAVVKYK